MKRDCNIFYCGEGVWKAEPSKGWMELTGSDPHGIRIMMEKDQIYPIFVTNIYFGAGNILKQDMLSLGGDVVVHKFFVNGKMESGSIILLGTAKQYRMLQTKMYAQHWGLKELAEDLKIVMENLKTYRELYELDLNLSSSFNLDLSGIDFSQKESAIEEVIKNLPLNRAKNEGFVILSLEKIPSEFTEAQIKKMLFFPAISRGYYIKQNGE
jgi:hypothetical protein